MRKPLLYLLILLSIALFVFHSCTKDEKAEQVTFSTTVNPSEGGMVSPSEGTYDSGDDITITATPSEGYLFKNWLGTSINSTQPKAI